MKHIHKDRTEILIFDFVSAVSDAEQAFNDPIGWIADLEDSIKVNTIPDVISVLGYWAKAGHIEILLSELDSSLLAQKYPFVQTEGTYEDWLTRFNELTGGIRGLDKRDKDLWESEINVQLMAELEKWTKALESKTALSFTPEYDDDYSLSDFSDRRDMLEYIHMGIEAHQATRPIFSKVTHLKDFQDGLKASDKVFRKLIGKNRELVDYADKTFWWRHPAK